MAAATVTLSTTTLSRPVGVDDRSVQVASSTGLTPLIRLYVDRELMEVVSLGYTDSLGTWVVVRRGVDSTATAAHNAGATVTIGSGSQFYQKDPVGSPPQSLYVSPWINTKTGVYWYALGDDGDPQAVSRWFQSQTVTYGQSSLGVRTTSQYPPENTAP